MSKFKLVSKGLLNCFFIFVCSVTHAQEEPKVVTPELPKFEPQALAKGKAKKSDATTTSYFDKMYLSRQSLVFDVRRERMMHPPVEVLDPTTGKWEADFLFMHVAASVGIDQEIQLNGRRIEVYIPSLDLGFRMHMPFQILQPFVGFGYTVGWLAASDPNNRGAHDITVLWQGSRSGIWGFYGELGADLLVPLSPRAGLGLRAYLRYSTLTSESIPDLGGFQVASTRLTPFIGIVFAQR